MTSISTVVLSRIFRTQLDIARTVWDKAGWERVEKCARSVAVRISTEGERFDFLRDCGLSP
jgi:hypothetical protein